MAGSKGTRLAVREARLITKELRLLGISPQNIAKIWAVVIGTPVICILGYLAVNYDPGTEDVAVISRVQIVPKDNYQSHIRNNTGIVLRSLTLLCSPEGDEQPTTSTTGLHPPLQPGYGEDVNVSGNCRLVRVNESHQSW